MIRRRAFFLVPSALALVLLEGCATAPTGPVGLNLVVHAGMDINPDSNGSGTPVPIRLYQLTDTASFDHANIFDLITHGQDALGTTLLGSEEVIIAPGSARTITRTLAAGTQYLGVAVLFRDVERNAWRGTAPVSGSGPTDLTLTISGLRATLA
ncbi:MAG TPA: type VI secretion system lipoprotein TssJ [Acetobacteraceae bacterium]|jgi:type VI secretion system protein VasD|nr:type VI secretion system lipoprotein TssJ [Acetobacteraceae bacterium]